MSPCKHTYKLEVARGSSDCDDYLMGVIGRGGDAHFMVPIFLILLDSTLRTG